MPKMLMLKGLPASGKTSHAIKLVEQGWVRVNKDDLRSMMHDNIFSRGKEKITLAARDAVIRQALRSGKNVVVDDTNFSPKHYKDLLDIALQEGAILETKDFDTDYRECIKRDKRRKNSVGEKVIVDMYKQYVRDSVTYVPPEGKPVAIIVDIDGTIAHMNGRGPYDLDKVGSDNFDSVVAGIATYYSHCYGLSTPKIILLSGREDSAKEETIEWLSTHSFDYDELHMRKAGDFRKDYVVKKELFDENIRDNYRVAFVLDDRDQVVDMWRNELGLKCLQVAEGNF